MDISPLGLLRNTIPNIPCLVKTTLLSAVGKSPNSDHQDALTEFIVNAARPIMQTPSSLLKAQINCNYDYGVWGKMWVSKYTIPAPSEQLTHQRHQPSPSTMGLRNAVGWVICELDTRSAHSPPCQIPDLVDVETEWTGYRSNASYVSPRPFFLNEVGMFRELMKEVDPHGPTILYFHGGAHCLMDPSTHRVITSNLARQTRGRILAVRYRLAPQHIFPAALLDAFSAYLALLSPPSGSFHSAVPAQKIVFAGDSSGGGLAASLALLLLTLSRHNVSITWNNDTINVPNPPFAGLALTSPYLDVTRSLPSTHHNAKWDIIAPPPLDAASPPFPPDAIWPTTPPRAETYCIADMCIHPLVSPVAAAKELWRGLPPVYVNVGWEGFVDEVEVWCRRVASAYDREERHVSSATENHNRFNDTETSGEGCNTISFDGYQGMPHCFSVIPWNAAGRTAFANWARFCSDAVRSRPSPTSSTPSSSSSIDEKRSPDPRTTGRSRATWTNPRTNTVHEFEVDRLGMKSDQSGYTRDRDLNDDVVDELWKRGWEWRVRLEMEMEMRQVSKVTEGKAVGDVVT